jgi:signal transduction histidine kinase
MSQEEFLELSQPYTRGKDKEKGSGLGLNICIAIMNEHTFKVSAEKLEIGTRINIELK